MQIKTSGNIQSIKESTLNEIDGIYEMEIPRGEFLPAELAERLAELTTRINREIAVYITRRGTVSDIRIGDSGTVQLPEVDGRRGAGRLSGVRCIHTHPSGGGMLSSVDTSSLLKLRLDAMVAIGVHEGAVTDVYAGLPVRGVDGEFDSVVIYGPLKPGSDKMNELFVLIAENEKASGSFTHISEGAQERAILVGLETSGGELLNGMTEGERLLEELEELAVTAGAVVAGKLLQKRQGRDAAYYIGKGKVEELSLIRQSVNADLIIFDDELSGAQVRNIEVVTGAKVIDRTALILDIFAGRARSREGKLQVELAQLNYRLPRLIGLGNQLSRLGGGIGTRGPGEKKLEVDRRHIRRRVNYLKAQLENLQSRRRLNREGRLANTIPAIALVGYTNVGKSSIMNMLCRTDVLAENKLFATLDPTTRALELPDGRQVMLVDTVGFIRKLPHDLIDAFKSTLEEAVNADLLLHVVDVSSKEAEIQLQVANEILDSLGALNKPVILVLNKVDLVKGEVPRVKAFADRSSAYEVSAVTGQGLEELLKGITAHIPAEEEEVNVLAPYSEGWIEPYIYENGRIYEKEYTEEGTSIKAVIRKTKTEKISKFLI